MAKKPKTPLSVEALKHDEAKRKNIPTAEYQSVLAQDEKSPVRVAYARRNRDLDPQLIWRGKDEQDWSDLVVHAPPLYIQEKVHPKVLIDDLLRQSEKRREDEARQQQGAITDLFADFNGLPSEAARTEFYQHDAHWSNRMILGDSLQVMASLAEREGLRGKVQCIYFDPPYGIKFNSNFQWSTTSRDVKDGNAEHITREPEQVKAFRDTWRAGIHSYLSYLRDRLAVARDLLTDSGSIFVQIGDENVHRVRALLDEVFGDQNFVAQIAFNKTTGAGSPAIGTLVLPSICDHILWYARDLNKIKFRQQLKDKVAGEDGGIRYREAQSYAALKHSLIPSGALVTLSAVTSNGPSINQELTLFGRSWFPQSGTHWKTTTKGMQRVAASGRIVITGNSLNYIRRLDDFAAVPLKNIWEDIGGIMSRSDPKVYVVQTSTTAVARCILMATDPGDLVLDPTCGSGTTAYVAEQWGRRWITVDTSRVALALARARIMGARYPFYLLADTREGQKKEAELTRGEPRSAPTRGDLRQGFVYERVAHITLKSIANNAEIDVIWDKFQQVLEPLRAALNSALDKNWEEWEIPRESGEPWKAKDQKLFFAIREAVSRGNASAAASALAALNLNLGTIYSLDTLPQRPAEPWSAKVEELHSEWWKQRATRQKEIDSSIAAKAEFEYLYDKPYEDARKIRVAGPFTVESLSPHRVLGVDENDELIDGVREPRMGYGERDFTAIILENLKAAGVQQAHKGDKIVFTSLHPWPGDLICAEGRYPEGHGEKRAAIFIGPEFGTVARPDLVDAAKEAAEAGFDVLIACAFNYDAHASEFAKLGRIPVLKARMNADLHMAEDLKNTGKGNLFVIFGEPDIRILDEGPEGELSQIRIKVKGVDVFDPSTGEVRSDGAEGIACWFIDTDYNEESFFVRHAYFLGANDPYKALKTTLKAEIDLDAWLTLNSDTSRPFDKPNSGRIAVKVINHLGDEVMKVFKVA
jgi:adenine-specific DNA-methyltransferase